jgi:hypothetical protein
LGLIFIGMKIIITENKYNEGILRFIETNFYPDYNWGPELHDFYRKDVETYGYYEFLINDDPAYSYWGRYKMYDYEPKTLVIYPVVCEQLNNLFGNRWVSIFKEWFEEKSGLDVDHVVTTNME